MSTDLGSFESFLDEMVQTTAVARVAKGIGAPIGAKLEDDVSKLTGEIAYKLGLGEDFFETGGPLPMGSALSTRISSARRFLNQRSGTWLKSIKANVGTLIAIGALYTGYTWVTEDERVRLAKIEAEKQLAQEAIAADPQNAAKILGIFGAGSVGGLPFSTLALVGLGLVGVWLGLRFYEASR